MINKNSVIRLLDTIVHPETGQGLSSGGFIKDVVIGNDGRRIEVLLKFPRVREPFAASLRRKALVALSEAFTGIEISVEVFSEAGSGNSISASAGTSVSAGTAASVPAGTSAPAGSGDFGSKSSPAPSRHLPGVKRVIAVASGKGGVGKSTVAANLAVTLAEKGLRVGVLDADIYGPSQPALFGVEDYMPPASGEEPDALIVPVESRGVKVMSIGFFIDPSDALVWRGPMATNALRQLIRQTAWGELDYLLIDLPPGTGDVHLSVVHDLALDGAIVVSTPGELALADVRRGVQMFRSEGINVPVLGIVENMAWFSPAELPGSRYYVFGKGGARRFASEEGLDFLGEIPLVLPSGADRDAENASPAIESPLAPYYSVIAEKIVDKLSKVCWKP